MENTLNGVLVQPIAADVLGRTYILRPVADPLAAFFIEEGADPEVDAAHVTAPKPFVVAELDRTVPPYQTRAVYEAASEPKEYLEIPGARHIRCRHGEHGARYEARVIDFLQRHLGLADGSGD